MYALKVQSKEVSHKALFGDDIVVTKDGEWFWIIVDCTGCSNYFSHSAVGFKKSLLTPIVKVFNTKEEAISFGKESGPFLTKKGEGHPWWCEPNGVFEVVRVEPEFKQSIEGYKIVSEDVRCFGGAEKKSFVIF